MKKTFLKLQKTLLICITCLGLLVGCDLGMLYSSDAYSADSEYDEERELKEDYKYHPDKYVHFSRSTAPTEIIVPIDEIIEYDTRYPECNGEWFKNQLSSADIIIYNSYLYALENGCSWFTLYPEDAEKDFRFIREAFCLDSPFLEQNFYLYGERFYKNPVNYIGKSVSFSIENFAQSRWDKKLEALEKCREIVKNIPYTYSTQLQKMQYVYQYVCDNVEYVAYEGASYQDYLYDAVCNGKTNCDGYSNMLNLLFNLLGVECCEASGSNVKEWATATDEERLNANGHTWVVAKIDGVYYNFDPTFEDTTSVSIKKNAYMYFGFSDELVSVKYLDCEEYRPKCTNTSRDYNFADIIVDNVSDNSNLQTIAKKADELHSLGIKETVVVVDKILGDRELQKFVDQLSYKMKKIAYFTVESYADESGYTTMLIKSD